MHGYEGMGFGMGWWWIIGFILIAAIIWAIVRSSGKSNNLNSTGNQKSSRDILKDRYARGEISKEEYEVTKRDLEV